MNKSGYLIYVEPQFVYKNSNNEIEFTDSIKKASTFFYTNAKEIANKYNGLIIGIFN
jgi:hypothetical protein